MDETREFIYEQIKYYRHDVGHAINWKGIMIAAFKQPPHIANHLKDVAEQMISEGLIEKRDDGVEILTQKGYNEIWGLN